MKRFIIRKLKLSVVLLLMSMSVALAQTGTITGKIVDGAGSPIIGANIVVVGTTTGTVTDIDGNYSLEVPAGTVEVSYSFVGYLPETNAFTIGDGTTTEFDVTLIEDLQALDEVVVIGYGTQKKSDLTGAVTTVTGEQLQDRVTEDLGKALQGLAAGVDVSSNSGSPGAPTAIRIRGTGTINNADPIFVVDGLVMDAQAISFLNPSDIENISVLKDASSTAIYGSRGANGVIMVTTKKGKQGDTKVNFSTYYGTQTAPNWVTMMDGPQYAENKNKASFFPIYDPDTVTSTDWIEQITRTAPMYNANLSFSGGSDKATYLVSASYFNQDGVIKRTNFKRYTIRVNTEINVKKWLTIGQNLQVTSTNRDFVSENNTYNSIVSAAMFADPITPVYDANGDFQPLYTTAGGNPLQRLEEGTMDQNSKGQKITGSAFAQFNIIEGLAFKSTFGGEIGHSEYYRYIPTYTFGLGNLYPDLYNNFRRDISWQWENYANYNKTFGIHNISLMAGVSASSWEYKDIRGSNTTGPVNEDVSLRYFDMWSRTTDILGGSADHASLYSLLGRVNYGLLDRYMLTFSVRRDGSSHFGPQNKQGWFPSAALAWKFKNESFMQNISFISSAKLRLGWGQIGNEKIPTGLYVGTITNGLHYTEGDDLREGSTALRPPNPALKWETTTSTNVGIDLGVLSNKLLISAEYYIKSTTDMLAQVELPRISGVPSNQSPWANIGRVDNKGVELSLTYRKMEGDFRYEIGGNISRAVNKVVDLGGKDRVVYAGTYGQNFGPLTVTQEGKPIASFFGYITEGIFQSYEEVNTHAFQNANTQPGDFKYKDVNGDGVIDDRDQTFIGSPHPDFTYSFNFNFYYKDFDLNFSFQGVKGGDILMPYKSFSHDALSGANNMHTDVLGAWTEEAPSTTTPRVGPIDYNGNFRISDYYLEDGSYLRLKTAQIGYTLTSSIAERVGIDRMRVYVGGQNLLTFTKYTGNDPEVGLPQYSGNTDSYQQLQINVDYGLVPHARVYTVGLDISF